MPLTKRFTETIKADLQKSPGFRRALLREAVGCMVAGDVETGKSVLRHYINGTIGFIQLDADLEKSPKVLMRMFGASGNPQAKNLFEIVATSRRSTAPSSKSSNALPERPKRG